MNFKKILAVIFLIKTTSILYSLGDGHLVTSIIINETESRDFKEEVELAHEWGKENWKDWIHKITKEEQSALEAYVAYSRDVNGYLREQKGVIEKPNDRSKGLLGRIHAIDRALDKGKLPESIHVYRRARETMFGLEPYELRDEVSGDKKVNSAVLEKIKSQFENKDFIEYGFLSTSLSKAPSRFFNSTDHSLLLRIKVPGGLNGAYVSGEIGNKNETEILIARGYTIKYESFSIITEGIHNIVKVEASLRKI